MILTEGEIRELTERTQRTAQRRVLTYLGIEHRARPDGTLVVLREHVARLLKGIAGMKRFPTKEPNWGALAKAT
jgi:hypothetical protein